MEILSEDTVSKRDQNQQQHTDNITDSPAIGVPPGRSPTRSLEVDAIGPYVGPRQSRQVVVVPRINERVPEYEGSPLSEINTIKIISPHRPGA